MKFKNVSFLISSIPFILKSKTENCVIIIELGSDLFINKSFMVKFLCEQSILSKFPDTSLIHKHFFSIQLEEFVETVDNCKNWDV